MSKNWMKFVASLVFMVVVFPATGLAQNHGINDRQHDQQQRIRDGIRSGELTRREARRLEIEQARIRRDEARARHSGGQFTARERLRIQRELNHSSRDIRRQKHDRQDR